LRLTAVTSVPAAFPRISPSPYDFIAEFTRRPFLGPPCIDGERATPAHKETVRSTLISQARR
jgi:hypothetical protein